MKSECQIERMSELARLARDVFGSDEKAQRWIAQWSPLLGGVPSEMTDAEDEYQRVKDELVRIEYGDFT